MVMFKYLVNYSYITLILMMPINAMQRETPEGENSILCEPKSLKIQSLQAVATVSTISDEQIDQLPQEVQKIARLLRYTKGNVNKAFLKALSLRGDICTMIFKATCIQNNGVIPISIELDSQKLLEQSYSVEDIRMLIECGVDVYNVPAREQTAFIRNIHILDRELITMLYNKFYRQNTIEGRYSTPFLTGLCEQYLFP